MRMIVRLAVLLCVALVSQPVSGQDAVRRPNVLFIAIDDQNDWIGCLGGHPLVKTPHIDALAARGTLFTNAHCQAPLCNPSRTSLMLSLRPSTTGIHGLEPWFRRLPEYRDRVALPQHFAQHGYHTLSTGKLYHSLRQEPKNSPLPPEFQEWGPAGGFGPKPPQRLTPDTPGKHPLVDWGVWPLDNDDSTKGDTVITDWAVKQIGNAPADQPYFLGVGYFLPHVPCYATQKWFDLYPDDDSVLPLIQAHDRADTPRSSWYQHWQLPEVRLKWLQQHNQWRNITRSYLACTSFVDSQIGRLLAALDESGQSSNTIVVLWSDHGWHLGEKEITGKNTLWDRSTRVPLIIAGPGVTAAQTCSRPAELLDIYPTLVELCSLPARRDLEGVSLAPQLRDAKAPRDRPAITSHNQGNFGIRTEQWRYIRYVDGAEELYDMQVDPHEWKNLAASRPDVCRELSKLIPARNVGPAAGSAHRILTVYDNQPVWEGKPIRPEDEIPE
jgi:choline-sulfatase